MQSSIYIISPVATDPRYKEKRASLTQTAGNFGLQTFYPLDHIDNTDLYSTLAHISAAALVIADLSFERPSCYYELGLVQATGKATILLAETNTKIHQSFVKQGIRFYKSIEEYAHILTNDISKTFGIKNNANAMQ